MFGNHRYLSYTLFSIGVCLAGFSTTHAALKDSDVDGLTDEAEARVYRTDPENHDTDNDGFDDGYEITDHTNPLDSNDTPFSTKIDEGNLRKERLWMTAFYVAAFTGVIAGLGYVFTKRRSS